MMEKRPIEHCEGFVYSANRDDGPMKHARQGAIISVEDGRPPWIVVDREPSTAIVAEWPGRLWSVRIIDAAPPLPYATNYTQAVCVEVLGEASAALLFGAHGEGVIRVLECARALSRTQADELAVSRLPGAAAAYDRTFRGWARACGIPIDEHNHDGTLALGFSPPSPVNWGLVVLDGIIFERAKAVDGEDAIRVDEDDEIRLIHPWPRAGRVLRDAALAIGAADFVDRHDQDVLLAGWKRVFGPNVL